MSSVDLRLFECSPETRQALSSAFLQDRVTYGVTGRGLSVRCGTTGVVNPGVRSLPVIGTTEGKGVAVSLFSLLMSYLTRKS